MTNIYQSLFTVRRYLPTRAAAARADPSISKDGILGDWTLELK